MKEKVCKSICMCPQKVTIMVLKVDLQCSKCYKKVKKVLCKFPQIQDQVYDEKNNKVTIKVVSCNPEKIRDKLFCKGDGAIKSIEILEPEKPKPPEKPKEPEKPKPPEKPKEPEKPKPPEKPKKPEKPKPKPPVPTPCRPPAPSPDRDCCRKCYDECCGGQCCRGCKKCYEGRCGGPCRPCCWECYKGRCGGPCRPCCWECYKGRCRGSCYQPTPWVCCWECCEGRCGGTSYHLCYEQKGPAYACEENPNAGCPIM